MRFDISRSTFRAASSLSVQCCAMARELVVRVRRRLAGEHGLDQPLRDEIREPPVRRRRMRVVLDGEAEVPGLGIAGPLEHVLARPHQLDDRERQVGEVDPGSAARRATRNSFSAFESGVAGSVRAEPCRELRRCDPTASACRTTRRIDDTRCASSSRATAPFAAIMKSSMSSVASVLVLRARGRRPARSG